MYWISEGLRRTLIATRTPPAARVMQLQQGRHVRTQGGDAIVTLQPPAAQRGGHAFTRSPQLGICPAALPVDDGDPLRVYGGAAVQERHGIELGTAPAVRAGHGACVAEPSLCACVATSSDEARRYVARRRMATGVSSAP
jgi:hypothetical protein